jgi:hypothetical protein
VKPCLIVDVNVSALVREGKSGSVRRRKIDRKFDYEDIERGLTLSEGPCKDVVLSYGGRLADELLGDAENRRWLTRLDEAGKARIADYEEVEAITLELIDGCVCSSTDPHIVALARISGARILCTNDEKLEDDFRNRSLVNPPGRIYVNKSHNNLIRERCK